MIIVRVHMLRGRSTELKHQLLRQLTEQTATTLGVERQSIRVFIVELEPDHWGIAGEPASKINGRSLSGSQSSAEEVEPRNHIVDSRN
ncbi:tautomerase family protein [Effusibacillus lacus]|uniref:Tautomerase n=1 Tax=Effusibacillus lacus TaxID=1348429 RepID=A0A292YE98_9BACL|nr:2-hydroxymuconate tautomerase family protein [Effusibacillus lacus]TCS76943.1 4-oxalocrotonate tautomerase [Effusibacillus lacus]GAX91272.1 4-oxalocrotonate tautomerase [Effusibacillus lacus]